MQSDCIRCKHSQHMPKHGGPAVRTNSAVWRLAGRLLSRLSQSTTIDESGNVGYKMMFGREGGAESSFT
jgi:hypothetical protein